MQRQQLLLWRRLTHIYYITEKTNPAERTKNDKRTIRWRAEKLVVTDGVLYYEKKNWNEVQIGSGLHIHSCM